jgi:hypothetical protein
MVEKSASGTSNVVLVHGGFVDDSGWESVYNILKPLSCLCSAALLVRMVGSGQYQSLPR